MMNEYEATVKLMKTVLLSRALYLLTKILTMITLAVLAVTLAATGKLMLTEGVAIYAIYNYTEGKIATLKDLYDYMRSRLERLDPND